MNEMINKRMNERMNEMINTRRMNERMNEMINKSNQTRLLVMSYYHMTTFEMMNEKMN